MSSSLNCNWFLQLEILLSKFVAVKLNTMQLMFCSIALNKINIIQKQDMGAEQLHLSVLYCKYANNKLSGVKLLFYGVFTTYLLHNISSYMLEQRTHHWFHPFSAKLWMNQIVGFVLWRKITSSDPEDNYCRLNLNVTGKYCPIYTSVQNIRDIYQ